MAGDQLFELRRRTFDTPSFRGIEFIEVEAKSIINHVPGSYLPFNWTINPYRGCSHACTYCFARATHTYMDMDAGRDFETKIVVKVNAPDRLRRELRAKRWKGDHIAMGTATDPYQRAEGRYKLMPRIIEALAEVANPFSILTKGTLILRDFDLLVDAARRCEISTAFSIATLDETVWRRSEPGTPHPCKRMEAVAKLNEAGIPCGVMVAPVLPGISDSPDQLRAVVSAALDAGATHVSPILLHLRPGVKEVYMRWLQDNYPELVQRHRSMYSKNAYAAQEDRNALGDQVRDLVAARAPKLRSAPRLARKVEPEVEAEQLRLI
jgi:DNA repair photolyase